MMKPKIDSKSHGVRIKLNNLFSHASLLLSLIVLVCFVLDRFNDAMDFMTADISKNLFALTAIVSITASILSIINLWIKPRR